MNTNEMIKATIVFVLLTLAGVGLVLGSAGLADSTSQQVLLNLGSALFGGALAFFLVQMFDLQRRARE
jgi:protein-S-isoprenylcysteine O-methyltransferase Ste14